MSLRPLGLTACAFLLAGLASSADAAPRDLRDSGKERLAAKLVRLLPSPPQLARGRMAPVPVNRTANEIGIWIDRELVWVGTPDNLHDFIVEFPEDLLVEAPRLPPYRSPRFAEREICVGQAVQGSLEDMEDGLVLELDCEPMPRR